MKALLPSRHVAVPSDADRLRAQQDADQPLLKPLLDLAENSDYLIAGSVGEFLVGQDVFQIPRFIFMGPGGGGDTIRLGIFAAIHGDESEGTEAVIGFLEELERRPRIAKGYHLYVYPICNPTGFIARTHNNFSGEDLSEHFWRGSSHPEVYYLEREMGVLHFQGVVSLHAKYDLDAFILHTSSAVLNHALAQPAIQAAQRVLPGSFSKGGQGHDLPHSLPGAFCRDFLVAADELTPVPFELHFNIPKQAPRPSQIFGTVSALISVLDSYRGLLSIGQNI